MEGSLMKHQHMKHTLTLHAQRAGIALAAAVALSALGTGPAQAQEFTRAEISLDRAGNLTCTFRETGLGAFSVIAYTCGAEALGVVSGCYVRNKFVGPTAVSIFKDVSSQEHEGQPTTLVAKNNGTILATLTAAIPESEGGEQGHLCTEPAEERVIAVRWCNASLVDVTNNIVGASVGELFEQLESTGTSAVVVPTCAELQAAPPTP
jgi:hypothetical protein